MSTLSEDVLRFAEEPEAEISEPVAPEGRVRHPKFCLMLSASPTMSTVTSVRTTEAGLDDTIAEIRAVLKERGYTRAVWRIGPSSRPTGLRALLAERGFVAATRPPIEPTLHAMVLAQAPPAVPPNVEARLVRGLEEYRVALDIAMEAFELTPEDAADWRAAAPKLWEQQDGVDRMTLIAYVDGQPAGFAWAASGPSALFLCGSGVLAAKRGRGAYRALLAARWTRAVELGKPALVIQAGEMSRPIAARCGFQELCKIELLDDPLFI